MANNTYCHGCDHEALGNMLDCNPGHFTVDRCEKENYPTHCADCKESFLELRKLKKLTDMQPAYCCKNAINHRELECVWGVCKCCYVKREDKLNKGGKNSNKRTTRGSISIEPKKLKLS